MPSSSGEAKQYFCTGCFAGFGPQVEVEGAVMLKSQLAKRKNEEDLEEPWVQCDACQQWVHQICTLFNGRRNEGGESAFTCPSCMLDQMMRAERTPTVNRPSSQQPATSLPKTALSDYLEQYLFTRLASERQDRARVLGKTPEEVPGADGLCIRVVSCVDKRLDVKSQFYHAFSPANYPDHFMYRSKARAGAAARAPPPRAACSRSRVLTRCAAAPHTPKQVLMLFQKIEGVDVCLFCARAARAVCLRCVTQMC